MQTFATKCVMIFWVLILMLIIVIGYVVFAPFYLEINSATGVLRLRFHKAASARVFIKDNILVLLIKVLWWRKEIVLPPVRKPVKNKPKATGRRKKKLKVSFTKIWCVLKSFRISRCYIAVDMGYMPYNGLLYPLLMQISRRTGKTILINFNNEDEIILEINNTAARMLWAYIRA